MALPKFAWFIKKVTHSKVPYKRVLYSQYLGKYTRLLDTYEQFGWS